MKKAVLMLFVLSTLGVAQAAAPSYPDWAYGVPTKDNEATAPRDDGTKFTLPGSQGHFTRGQVSGDGSGALNQVTPRQQMGLREIGRASCRERVSNCV